MKGKTPTETLQWAMGQVLWRRAPDRREDTPHTLSTCWVHKLPGLKRGLQMVSAKQDVCHLSVEKRVRVTWLWRGATQDRKVLGALPFLKEPKGTMTCRCSCWTILGRRHVGHSLGDAWENQP